MTHHSPVFKSAESETRYLEAYNKAMKLWPIQYETRDVQTQFGSTHIVISGPKDAPPLVLLHCALMTSAIWSPIIEDLSRDYRTYAVDVIGDIGMSIPTKPPATLQEYAQWLIEVFEELDLEKTRVLGWSFGGFLSANFAIHEPQRVEKLALLAPFMTFTSAGPGFFIGFLPLVLPIRPAVRFFERRMCYKKNFGPQEHSELLYQRFVNGRMMMKIGPKKFSDDELKKLTMPTLLLVGEQELLYNPNKAVNRAKQVLPNGEAEIIPQCNHAVVSDQTERVKNRLLSFFK